MRSMTGFGRATSRTGAYEIEVEVRSVNHRFLSVRTTLPEGLERYEPDVEKLLKASAQRGTFTVRVHVQTASAGVEFEEYGRRLAILHRTVAEAKRKLGQRGPVAIEALLAAPSWMTRPDATDRVPRLWPVVRRCLAQAVQKLVRDREREGRLIAAEVRSQVETIAQAVEKVRARAPDVLAQYERKLRERVERVMKDLTIENVRADLAREVVVFADKCDVTEEVNRIAYHIDKMRGLVREKGPAGRKFEFLVQELTRETSTLGAKSNDATISGHAVEIRTAIEKIKEQAENLE